MCDPRVLLGHVLFAHWKVQNNTSFLCPKFKTKATDKVVSALSRSSLYWDEPRRGAPVAAARQQAHARHVIPVTTDKPDLVQSPRVLFWAMLHLDREKCKQHRFLVPMITMFLATDTLSCAASCICKGCRAVSAQTLPLSLSLFWWLWFFLSVQDQCGVRLLPSHVELDEVNSLMSLAGAKVGHACVVEH